MQIIENRITRAKQDKSQQRLVAVLLKHFPESASDLIQWAVSEYLETDPLDLEFRDQVAVIPGAHRSHATVGDMNHFGLLDDAVSLDLLWILDDWITDSVSATAPVGRLGHALPIAHETVNEKELMFEVDRHPVVTFEVRAFYEDNFLSEEEDRLEGNKGLLASPEERFGVLSLAAFEKFNRRVIYKTARMYLRSLRDEVRSWDDAGDLARSLYRLIYDAVSLNPRIYPEYITFDLIRFQAETMAEDEDVSPRRRRIYTLISKLPDIDESDPKRLKVHKDAKRLFSDDLFVNRDSTKPTPTPHLAKVLQFKKGEETPICDLCEANMVKRENKRTGQHFWGCSNFPKCKATQQVNS